MSSNPYAKRSQMAPAARAVRAYAAPVNRVTGSIAAFDPAGQGQFNLDSPPAPFIDLGWVENFQRTAVTKYEALRTGPGANITVQYRTQPEARLEFDLPSWGKLQLALSGGTQQMNVLAEIPTTMPEPSGGTPLPASPVQAGSTQTQLVLTSDQLQQLQRRRHRRRRCRLHRRDGLPGFRRSGTYLFAGGRGSTVRTLCAGHL